MTRHSTRFIALVLFLGAAATAAAQNFSVPAKGVQTFSLKDGGGRNQAVFYSSTSLEDITGTSSGVAGTVRFDPADVAGTFAATVTVDATTLKTGIAMRDEHLQSEGWLNAKQYPTITFTLAKLEGAKTVKPNVIEATASGAFTMHGVTKSLRFPVTLSYLPESEQTKKRAPGDLLVIRGKGTILLSAFGVKSEVIGPKVSDEIRIELNVVASNAVK